MANGRLIVIALWLALGSPHALPAERGESKRLADQFDRCDRLSNQKEECYSEIESREIAESGGRIQRLGNQLQVRTDTGVIRFSDGVASEPLGIVHTYLGTFGNKAYHLVMLRAWGSLGYLAISAKTGEKIQLPAFPEGSPSGSRVAVIAADEGSEVSEIAIWKLAPDRLVQEFRESLPPSVYVLYEFIGWDGESTVRLERTVHADPKRCLRKSLMATRVDLKFGEGAWRFADVPGAQVRCF